MEKNIGNIPQEIMDGDESQVEVPSTEAKQALFKALGFEVDAIANPETAPAVVDFAKFWTEAGLTKRKVKYLETMRFTSGLNTTPKRVILKLLRLPKVNSSL